MVRMRHPGLPEDQVINALPQQVQTYQRSGWEVIEDEPTTEEAPPEPGDSPPKTADQTSEAPATAGASALSGQPQRRARTTTAKGDDE